MRLKGERRVKFLQEVYEVKRPKSVPKSAAPQPNPVVDVPFSEKIKLPEETVKVKQDKSTEYTSHATMNSLRQKKKHFQRKAKQLIESREAMQIKLEERKLAIEELLKQKSEMKNPQDWQKAKLCSLRKRWQLCKSDCQKTKPNTMTLRRKSRPWKLIIDY